jgi:hypothetical protein
MGRTRTSLASGSTPAQATASIAGQGSDAVMEKLWLRILKSAIGSTRISIETIVQE